MPQDEAQWNPFEQYEDGHTQGGIVWRNQQGAHESPPYGLQIPHDLDWMENGKCVHSDLPFSEVTKGDRRLPRMRAICDTCPVQYGCLEYGLEIADEFRSRSDQIPGLWGGLLGVEIKRLWRETRR